MPMSGPTQEELARFAGVVRRLREYEAANVDPEVRTAAPDPDRDLREIERLLLAFPLPPEDGERAHYADVLRDVAQGMAPDDPETATLVLEAAALLRQAPPPAAGVSKEGVLAAIRRSFGAVADSIAYAELEAAIEALPETAPRPTLQARVDPWLLECFGEEIARDRVERNHRFLEESLELAQSCGCTEKDARALVAYVYGRPKGDAVGGARTVDDADFDAADDRIHEWLLAEGIDKALAAAKAERDRQAAAPPSGVDREAAARLVEDAISRGCFEVNEDGEDLADAIRVLPAAEPEDAWHYLPELPEVGVPCLLAARWRPESEPFVCFGEWTGFRWEVLEESDAEPLLYAWRPAPGPPPLPKAKPAARPLPVTDAELTED